MLTLINQQQQYLHIIKVQTSTKQSDSSRAGLFLKYRNAQCFNYIEN